MAEEEISFFANYKGWMAVKKRAIDGNTEPREVVAVLASINETASKKAYELSGVKLTEIDALVTRLTQGKRKGLSNLVEIFSSVKQGELKTQLLIACPDPVLLPIAESYFINSILRAIGYFPFVGAQTIADVWKDLKIPKPRGRQPKK